MLMPLAAHADEYAEVSRLLDTRLYKEALAKADRYLSNHPGDPQMRFLRGVALSDGGRAAEAIVAFSDITADLPELPEPYNNLAVLYASQNQLDKARAALELAVKANPSYATALENLGDIYARLASQAYDKAIKIDVGNAGLQPKLSVVRQMQGPDTRARTAPSTPASPVVVAAASGRSTSAAPSAAPASLTNLPLTPQTKGPATATGTAALTPTAATESASETSNPQARVDAALRSWAAAWSQKDLGAYFKAYTDDFAGPGRQGRQSWEEERRKRIMGKQMINVQLSDVVITVTGNKAKVRFRQSYNADALQVNSNKTLDLILDGDRWLIRREKDHS